MSRFTSTTRAFAGVLGGGKIYMLPRDANGYQKSLSPKDLSVIKTIFGLSLYIDCFPDAIRSVKDSDFIRRNVYSGKKNVVVGNSLVTGENKRRQDPHWHPGNLRHYVHDRFVNVKGQVRWIDGYWVGRGTARVVCEDAPQQPA